MKAKTNSLIQILLSAVITMLFIFPYSLFAQQEASFKDPRDNQVYQIKKMGKKTWMIENLKYNAQHGSWICNKDSSNLASYGRLYDWNSAMNVCPKGWNLPSEQDWGSMMLTLGGKDMAAEKLRDIDSTNQKITKKMSETGKPLSTLLGGMRHGDGNFSGVGLWGGFWSATATPDGVKDFLFARGDKGVVISTDDKASAFLVRCVKSK